MDALGNGGFWWRCPSTNHRFRASRSKSSDSADSIQGRSFNFPVKQAATAASLALTGDTIAQLNSHCKFIRPLDSDANAKEGGAAAGATAGCIESAELGDPLSALLSHHDWVRALRMASYGFLLYGPGSYAWYQYLDRCLPKPTFVNLSLKVLLNQIVLGPCVIAVVFGWNNLWLGKLSELPNKYKQDALPTLLFGLFLLKPV
ncbi:hypothetical protein ACLOJK_010671 [Asimina triloba]